jgi:hypothetical protein
MLKVITSFCLCLVSYGAAYGMTAIETKVKIMDHLKGKESESGAYQATFLDISVPLYFSMISTQKSEALNVIVRDPSWKKEDEDFLEYHSHRDCLYFRINLKRSSGKVEWVSSQNSGCKFLKRGSGKFLMKLVDELSTIAGVRYSKLEDAANLKCMGSGSSGYLRLLHFFQTGESWYESLGYVRVFPSTQEPLEEERKASIIRLRTYPLSEVRKILDEFSQKVKEGSIGENLEGWSTALTAKRVILLKFAIQEYEPLLGSEKNLGALMSLLWRKDCRTYIEIEKEFFSGKWLDRPDLFPFESDYWRYHGGTRKFRKWYEPQNQS